MSEVVVRFWAGARRASGHAEESLCAETVAGMRALLGARAELASLSAVVSFLVDGVQAGDGTRLHDGATVDVLPPFAGG
ncbi:MAG: MoaD/ThiS family protein [Jatrophihabitantaceae bacterium]